MGTITLELDNFINPAVGAEVSFHAISWNAGRKQSSIPSGGNLHYHSLPSGGTVEHSHEFGELIFLLSGSIIHRVNGEKQLLEPNSVVFVRPDDRHGFLPAPGAPDCELLLLSFHLELFVTISRYLEDDAFLHRYTESVLPAVFRVPESRMNELSLELLSLNAQGITPAIRKIRFKVLLAELFTRFFLPQEAAPGSSDAPEWLESLCEKMKTPDAAALRLHPGIFVQSVPQAPRPLPDRIHQRTADQPRRPAAGRLRRIDRRTGLPAELPEPEPLLPPVPETIQQHPGGIPQTRPRRPPSALILPQSICILAYPELF